MRSGKRNWWLVCFCTALFLVKGLPAPEYEQVAGNEVSGDPENSTGIYAKDAAKHAIGGSAKVKAQIYAGGDIHFETNVLLLSKDEVDTVIWAAIFGGRLLFEGERFNGSLLGQINGKAYAGFSEFAGVTGHLFAEANYTISDSSSLFFSDLFQYTQDPLDIAQDGRAERINNNLTGIFERQFAAWALLAGVVNTVLDYSESRFDALDYISLEGFVEGAFDVPLNQERLNLKETRAFLRLAAVQYVHQHQGLNDPFFFEAIAGLRGKWQTRFTWDVGVGIDAVSVSEDPGLPGDEDEEIAFAFAAKVVYQVGDRTVVTLAGSRRVEVSTVSNYAKVTRASLGLVHFFNERLNAEADVGYQYSQRSVKDQNLSRTNATVRANYMFKPTESLPMFRIYADVTFTSRDGDQTSSEYEDVLAGGGIAANF